MTFRHKDWVWKTVLVVMLAFIALFLAVGLLAAAPQTITGRPTVIDGDTIRMGDEKIRLLGIDAPEMRFPSGQFAKNTLIWYIFQRSGYFECQIKDRDRYNRLVALCSFHGEDVGEFLIKAGAAVPWKKYLGDEASPLHLKYRVAHMVAAENCIGIWSGDMCKHKEGAAR